LDGYDEQPLASTAINVITANGLHEWKCKVIVTCRDDRVPKTATTTHTTAAEGASSSHRYINPHQSRLRALHIPLSFSFLRQNPSARNPRPTSVCTPCPCSLTYWRSVKSRLARCPTVRSKGG